MTFGKIILSGMGRLAAASLRAAAERERKPLSPSDGARELPAELGRIIRPEAQPRWLLPMLSVITPAYIETILRGALVGNHLFQWQLFDLMEDTWPRLTKNLNELKRGAIRELTQHWRLQAWAAKGEAPEPEAEDRAKLVEEALFEMPGDPTRNDNAFEDTIYDLLDAWAKGVSLLELDWEQRQTEGLGTILAPRSSYWVHPKNYAWDGQGNLGLVLPDSVGGGSAGAYTPWARTDTRLQQAGNLEPLIPDKFIVAICRARTGHPLGGALLRPLAWWWCAANFSADWLLNYAQIFGLPLRWASYAPQAPAETISKICDMLANMGSAGWAAFPAGTTLDLKEASKGGNEMPQATMLDRADKQADLLILGQTLTTDVSKEGGARALGEVHADVRSDVIDAAAAFAARVLNTQAIPSVLRLNYGDDQMRPSFVRNEEEPEKAKANAEVLEIAVRTGIPVPVNFALEKLNIPKAEEGEELVKAPQPAGLPGMPQGEDGGSRMEDGRERQPRTLNLEPRTSNGEETNPDEQKETKETKENPEQTAMRAQQQATEKLTENVLEDLTGVEAKWLGGVKPYFRRLVAAALSRNVTDAEFVAVLERAQKEMPELFAHMRHEAVASALEKAMGAACANGAVRGAMGRKS